ncbi:MAG TPA: hypothetical protein P5511_08410, partial [Candidatus Goldiibacteriota bacterium]|nr:hypothetical protein [Candidatus Goldiibacteriota bacterium]
TVVTGAGSAAWDGSSWPSVTNLASGESAHFIWVFDAATAGAINFTSQVRAYDQNTGVTKSAVSAASGTIQTVPALEAAISAQPAVIGTGSTITVRMTVTNNGQAAAVMTMPAGFEAYGTAPVTEITTAYPFGVTINGGASASFTWTYVPTGTGSVSFSGLATALDANTGLPHSSAYAFSNAVLVQPNYPVMASWIEAIPNALSINQNFTVVMTVSNTGIVDANGVRPDPPYISIANTAISPVVPSSANISSAQAARFTWVYRTTAVTGTGIITAVARAGSGEASSDISSGNSNTITVYGPPDLNFNQMTILTPPATVSAGQDITLVMTLSNAGETAAVNVWPEMPLTRVGSATATLISGPVPVTTTLAALTGESSYTWVYRTGGSGALGFYGRAVGYDARTNAVYHSVSATSNQINVQSQAMLSASITADQYALNVGQSVTVRMQVANNGQSTASNV